MKLLLSFFLALLGYSACAKCLTRGMEFWPRSGSAIQQRPVVMVQGYADSQPLVLGLGTGSYLAYLQTDTERVPLRVVEVVAGQFNEAQAVLKTTCLLEAGKLYELILVGKGNKGNVIPYQNSLGGTHVRYTVAAGLDQTAPTWQRAPKLHAKTWIEYGCGPEAGVQFTAPVHDNSAYLIRASVKDLTTGTTSSYYLLPDATGTVLVGHGMCSGGFVLENGSAFSVTFAALDAAGNLTKYTGGAISFTKPAQSEG